MGLFSVKQPKPRPEPRRETYYIEPTPETNPDEATQEAYIEQENRK
jgi:hypothetical protein